MEASFDVIAEFHGRLRFLESDTKIREKVVQFVHALEFFQEHLLQDNQSSVFAGFADGFIKSVLPRDETKLYKSSSVLAPILPLLVGVLVASLHDFASKTDDLFNIAREFCVDLLLLSLSSLKPGLVTKQKHALRNMFESLETKGKAAIQTPPPLRLSGPLAVLTSIRTVEHLVACSASASEINKMKKSLLNLQPFRFEIANDAADKRIREWITQCKPVHHALGIVDSIPSSELFNSKTRATWTETDDFPTFELVSSQDVLMAQLSKVRAAVESDTEED